jgi:glycosyltransferase involved in cell wall biosynthesis
VRIGFIVSDLSNTRIGGISRVATEIGANLVNLGHEVIAYVLHRKGCAHPAEYLGMEIRYVRPFPSINPDYPIAGFSACAFRKFCRDAKGEPFDLIQSFNLNALSYPAHCKEIRGYGIATVLCSFETIMMDVRAKTLEFCDTRSIKIIPQILYETYLALVHERRYLRLADLVITEDVNTANALEKMGIDGGKIRLVPSGVDVERAELVSPPDLDLRQGAGGPVIGYIGRVDPRKGVQYLVAAFQRIRREYPEAILFLAGGSRQGYDETIRGVIERVGLKGSVRLLGRVDGDILPYYKLADVVVIPSLSEGIPITLGEAMASRVPVVITRLPGVVPFIKSVDLVFWAEMADPLSLFRAIREALCDSEREERLTKAFNFIGDYSWRRVTERYLEVYHEAKENRSLYT